MKQENLWAIAGIVAPIVWGLFRESAEKQDKLRADIQQLVSEIRHQRHLHDGLQHDYDMIDEKLTRLMFKETSKYYDTPGDVPGHQPPPPSPRCSGTIRDDGT